MDEVALDARAKVNLRLRIGPRGADGYHAIETIFCRISLRDRVRLRRRERGVELRVRAAGGDEAPEDVPRGATNLAVRAAHAFFRATGVAGGVEIELEKGIPAAAGLGGGSSDAAAVLLGLARLYDVACPPERWHALGLELGADVPFFLLGEPLAYATGRGERLAPLPLLPPAPALVLRPRVPIATAEAYRAFDAWVAREGRRVRPLDAAAPPAFRDWAELAPHAENDFEPALFERYPALADAKRRLLETGPLFAVLSGSGAALFAPYASAAHRDAAREACAALANADVCPVTAPD
jgi:4-diphosphocytidyl-2-C-methyl-D-erythritol kinase